MAKLHGWTLPVALLTAWMAVAAYVLTRLAAPQAMPVIRAQEVIIRVGPPGQAS
jgi:hypothetical protein